MFDVLARLTISALAEMASSLRQGALRSGIGSRAVEQIVGTGETEKVAAILSELETAGWRTDQLATLFDVAYKIRASVTQPEKLVDLVISGPDVSGVPTRDTLAVMQSLIA
ncbi:MAG: hypothetical protein KAI66_14840, partial [Lentisphaeria bacterium]|nr:hypothetical protein [Lentisphaeria bacterium]